MDGLDLVIVKEILVGQIVHLVIIQIGIQVNQMIHMKMKIVQYFGVPMDIGMILLVHQHIHVLYVMK